MNQMKVIERLREKAKENRTADDVLHAWATRDRARSLITVRALTRRMTKEGFEHDEKEYADFLKFLASIGLGHLDVDKNGRVRALKDVKISLPSLGDAVISGSTKGDVLKTVRRRNRFVKISPPPAGGEEKAPTAPTPGDVQIILTVKIGPKTLNIPVPKDFNPTEVSMVVALLQKGLE
jgi:hypothetical protein